MAFIKATATYIPLRNHLILHFNTLFLYIQQLAFIKFFLEQDSLTITLRIFTFWNEISFFLSSPLRAFSIQLIEKICPTCSRCESIFPLSTAQKSYHLFIITMGVTLKHRTMNIIQYRLTPFSRSWSSPSRVFLSPIPSHTLSHLKIEHL